MGLGLWFEGAELVSFLACVLPRACGLPSAGGLETGCWPGETGVVLGRGLRGLQGLIALHCRGLWPLLSREGPAQSGDN